VTSPVVSYATRSDATPEGEIAAIAHAYRFIIDCHSKRKAAPDSRPNDAERKIDDGATSPSIPTR
jgi:hypothetical protein